MVPDRIVVGSGRRDPETGGKGLALTPNALNGLAPLISTTSCRSPEIRSGCNRQPDPSFKRLSAGRRAHQGDGAAVANELGKSGVVAVPQGDLVAVTCDDHRLPPPVLGGLLGDDQMAGRNLVPGPWQALAGRPGRARSRRTRGVLCTIQSAERLAWELDDGLMQVVVALMSERWTPGNEGLVG